MKKILSIILTVTMVLGLVASFRAPTASAQTVTKSPDYLPYGWVIFTANGPLGAGTAPVIHGKTEAQYIYYTMGDIIQGIGGTPGGQVALVGYGPNHAFPDPLNVIVSVAPVATDLAGTFAIATSSVPQDGEYAIRDDTGGVLGNVLVTGIYIRYKFSIDQTSLAYNCSAQVISGWVFRGDGTGAAYSNSITPAGQAGAYTTFVHVVYPDGTDVFTSVLANGQFALAVNINQKGVYRVYVEDNYGDTTNYGDGVTEFGFVYAELTTGHLSITLSTYVDPTYLYNETTYQQEVVLHAVDQDGDPVSGATFSILTGFAEYTVYEIAPGFYKVIGIKDSAQGLASFQVTSSVGGDILYSNVVGIPFKALSDFNPVVSVDVVNTQTSDNYQYSVTEWTYDTLPCTVGYSLIIKPGVFDVIAGYSMQSVSATVSGPVSEIFDNTPVTEPLWTNSMTVILPAAANVVTQVGYPTDEDEIIYDGTYGGMDNYYTAPRYLVTGPGTISVEVDQANWKAVDPNGSADDPYNVCCDSKTATFTICRLNGCDVTTNTSYITVGTATDLKVSITSSGMSCGCNVIVHVIPTWTTYTDFFTLANGTKVPDLWYNISGSGIALPFGMTAGTSSYGASSDGTGTFTFAGVTANYCDYLKVEVFTTVTPTGCTLNALPVWVFAYVQPYEITAGIASTPLSYQIVGITNSTNNYLVAGVPDTVIISGFVTGASLYYLRMDVGGGTYYNTDAAYSATDNGDGTYTIQLTPPPSYNGTAYPNQIKIALRMPYSTNPANHCRLVGTVIIPVKMPTFTTTLSTGCGETIPNDNKITEGFAEMLTLSNLVDPRTNTPLIISDFFVKTSSSGSPCYIPTAWTYIASCAGCTSTVISIVALDNPNIDATPVVRPYITLNGVNVRLYGAELTVISPTIQVTPNTNIPFTSLGQPVTMLTFSGIDAHGKPMCGRTFSIYDINTMTDNYSLLGYSSETLYSICDIDTGGIPYRPSFATVDDHHTFLYNLVLGSSYQYHTGTTGSDGTVIYPFGPGTGGRYAATVIPDVAQAGAPIMPLKAFMSKMKLIFETTYVAPVVDTTAPTVSASAPATVTLSTVKVTGTVTDNVGVTQLWVGATKVDFAPDGTFATTVSLNEGANTIKVVAYDAAGNKGEKDLTVTYTKPVLTVLVLQIGSDIMTINGHAVQLDAAPEIVNGSTFLPIRAIAEALGATVTWIPETQGITITLGTTTIGLQIGNTSAVINGNVVPIIAPYIKNGRTMVPFRVIVEGVGGTVEWDPVQRTVTVTIAQ